MKLESPAFYAWGVSITTARDLDFTFGDDRLSIIYGGSVNLKDIANVLADAVGLPAVLDVDLPVLNPSLTLVKPAGKDASYEFNADRLPVAELSQWVQDQAIAILPDRLKDQVNALTDAAQDLDLAFGNDRFHIAYNGNLDIASLVNQLADQLGLN